MPTYNAQLAIENPEQYGFSWEWTESEDKSAGTMFEVPAPRFFDYGMVVTALGENAIIASLNGAGLRHAVRNGVAVAHKKERLSRAGMLEKAAQLLGGIRGNTPAPTWTDLAGKRYSSKVEADAANLAIMIDRGLDAATARTVLGL